MGILFVFYWSLTFSQNTVDSANVPPNVKKADTTIQTDRADKMIDFAKNFLGVPYKYAGSSPAGFDCSGFVHFILKKYGIDISRSSRSMAGYGKRIPLETVREGDLLFFTGSNRSSGVIGHVGVVIENKDKVVRFIHSDFQGVRITQLNGDKYYVPRFIMARRIEY